ncbi:MAG TPA: hypothetical protein VGO93_00985 [Candidatus Xenobia bacterium]|jgi:hypothetical protein
MVIAIAILAAFTLAATSVCHITMLSKETARTTAQDMAESAVAMALAQVLESPQSPDGGGHQTFVVEPGHALTDGSCNGSTFNANSFSLSGVGSNWQPAPPPNGQPSAFGVATFTNPLTYEGFSVPWSTNAWSTASPFVSNTPPCKTCDVPGYPVTLHEPLGTVGSFANPNNKVKRDHIRVIGFGAVGNEKRAVVVEIWFPPFPWVVGASGPIITNNRMCVKGVICGNKPNFACPNNAAPGSLLTNGKCNPALTLSNCSIISGCARVGGRALISGNATIDGCLIQCATPIPLPQICICTKVQQIAGLTCIKPCFPTGCKIDHACYLGSGGIGKAVFGGCCRQYYIGTGKMCLGAIVLNNAAIVDANLTTGDTGLGCGLSCVKRHWVWCPCASPTIVPIPTTIPVPTCYPTCGLKGHWIYCCCKCGTHVTGNRHWCFKSAVKCKACLTLAKVTGYGLIVSQGNVTITCGACLSSCCKYACPNYGVAVLANGCINVLGKGTCSYFQGLLYTRGNLKAKQITILGAFIANGVSPCCANQAQATKCTGQMCLTCVTVVENECVTCVSLKMISPKCAGQTLVFAQGVACCSAWGALGCCSKCGGGWQGSGCGHCVPAPIAVHVFLTPNGGTLCNPTYRLCIPTVGGECISLKCTCTTGNCTVVCKALRRYVKCHTAVSGGSCCCHLFSCACYSNAKAAIKSQLMHLIQTGKICKTGQHCKRALCCWGVGRNTFVGLSDKARVILWQPIQL